MKQLRGEVRVGVKQKLREIDPTELESVYTEEYRKGNRNREDLPNIGVLRCGKTEMRAENDMHKNDAVELYLRTIEKRIKSAVHLQLIPKFPLILCSNDQLNVLSKESENGPVRLFLDATGDIVRSISDEKILHHALVLPVKRLNQGDLLVPIAEFTTDDNTSKNISFS